jgi:NTP pyrophosphatase (non-canonical NTP hydrolase)
MTTQTELCNSLNELSEQVHQNNVEKGFWEGQKNVGELLMLVVSELGEAIEAHRKGRIASFNFGTLKSLEKSGYTWEDSNLSFKSSFEEEIKDTFQDEIADAIIRLLDLSAGLGIDIGWHIDQKLNYNKTRAYKHGKAY